jgi:hypothetical protein
MDPLPLRLSESLHREVPKGEPLASPYISLWRTRVLLIITWLTYNLLRTSLAADTSGSLTSAAD